MNICYFDGTIHQENGGCNMVSHNIRIPVEISPMGSDPPFIDTEWGALKKAYKMDGHQEFAWIQNGRAQSEP